MLSLHILAALLVYCGQISIMLRVGLWTPLWEVEFWVVPLQMTISDLLILPVLLLSLYAPPKGGKYSLRPSPSKKHLKSPLEESPVIVRTVDLTRSIDLGDHLKRLKFSEDVSISSMSTSVKGRDVESSHQSISSSSSLTEEDET